MHNFLSMENSTDGHKIRGEEPKKLPFILGGGWLLHIPLVFPFMLPTAISVLLTRERKQDCSYTSCCPHPVVHTVGIGPEAFVSPVKCRIHLPGAEGGDGALNVPH